MTTFFKKIRRKLIEEKKLQNYLFYAFGEILLVVIGILIALQINNWNEGKKEEQELNLILNTIKKDLQNDIEESRLFIEMYETRLNKMDTILGGHATMEYLKTCNACPKLTTGISKVTFNKRGYDLLKNYSIEGNMVNDSLLLLIDGIYSAIETMDDLVVEKFEELTYESLDDMKKRDWFLQFLEGDNKQPEILDYIKNDKEHLARLAMLRLLVRRNYIRFLEGMKTQSEIVIDGIDNRVSN